MRNYRALHPEYPHEMQFTARDHVDARQFAMLRLQERMEREALQWLRAEDIAIVDVLLAGEFPTITGPNVEVRHDH